MGEKLLTTGSVAALWCYPVKSMAGAEVESAPVTASGLLGDRAYALIDREDGAVVSAKSVRKWPDLLRCQAAFSSPPSPGAGMPPVRITLPDGTVTSSDQPDVDEVLSHHLGRPVRLSSDPPGSPVLEQYHPESDVVTAEAMPPGTFFDLGPLHLLTTATLDQLRGTQPDADFDARRFRPNLVIRSGAGSGGFPEGGWMNAVLLIGDSVEVRVTADCFRCVMTTLPQSGLPRDPAILRTAVRHNRARVGVYARALHGGTLRRGDLVRICPEV